MASETQSTLIQGSKDAAPGHSLLGITGFDEPVFSHLSGLKPGMRAYIVVRVCRLWETILSNGSVAVTTDLIIADKMEVLAEGKIYKVVRFQVVPWESNYKPLPSDHAIFFNSSTEIELLDQPAENFPRYYFDIAGIDEINTRKEKDPLLTDTAGLLLSITEVGQIRVSTRESVDQRDLCIKLPSGHELKVSIWQHHARNLDAASLVSMCPEPVLVIAGTIVKEYRDTKYLSSSSATMIYTNPAIDHIRLLRESLLGLEGARSVVFTEVDKFKLPPTAKDVKGKDYAFTIGVPDQSFKQGYLRYKIYAFEESGTKDAAGELGIPEDLILSQAAGSSINPPAAHDMISLTAQKAVYRLGDVVPDDSPGTPYISHVLPSNKAPE
ncbi:Nucleic acid-binding protein [Corchorus olitorius]|uniref:Nucleic acid-binding protein n=1 Tax=Corchorus olitorius TaxID=93759 RepID=A0A1R3GWB0_9ROSI|nr:Nucleic acid-binding protein [Corchorus olitorius]